ncbi:hypothetical protein LEP1GSC041_1616 [Leptospira noguchii str. 2006001870]|nr:hypothetical protein LEP1GSC041_1616 [Leptospira noguchii str. 2006001870]
MNLYKINFEFDDNRKTTILRKNLIFKSLFLNFIKVIIFHFSFHRTKEELSDCVVPTIPFSTIAPSNLVTE